MRTGVKMRSFAFVFVLLSTSCATVDGTPGERALGSLNMISLGSSAASFGGSLTVGGAGLAVAGASSQEGALIGVGAVVGVGGIVVTGVGVGLLIAGREQFIEAIDGIERRAHERVSGLRDELRPKPPKVRQAIKKPREVDDEEEAATNDEWAPSRVITPDN